MARATGFGSFNLKMRVRVQSAYADRLANERAVAIMDRNTLDTTVDFISRGKLGDDETLTIEWAEFARSIGLPDSAWTIDWGASDFMTADR